MGSLALRAVAWGIARLPFAALPWLGAVLGWLAGGVLRIRRDHVERAMRTAGIARPGRSAAAMYRGLGASLMELLWLSARGEARPSRHAAFDAASQAQLDAAFARGRGVVLAASHTGNWELAAAAVAGSFPLLAVTKRMSVGTVDRFVRDARAARGIDLATRDDAFPRARRALRRGGVVAMMIDQVPDRRRHGLPVTFLGAPALADRSPAALAAQMRAPLVVAATARARGASTMRVLAVLEPPAPGVARGARRAWVDEATRDATAALDAFVRAAPADWLWMHRRWRIPEQ
jgi:KDO2-lipid IV(A) lauroyltransferase